MCNYVVVGQSSPEPNCSPKVVAASRVKPPPRPVSLGVINGRAMTLVKPVYPPTAREVRIAGEVQVTVLISEEGCVVRAEVQSGHPLLRTSALNAARASTFMPTSFGGVPVLLWGLIVYRFQSEWANWLELGYSSENLDFLETYLPAELELQRRLLAQGRDTSIDERAALLANVHGGIESYLKVDAKAQWLYELGRTLRSNNPMTWMNTREESIADLRDRLSKAPSGVSEELKKALLHIASATEWDDIRRKTEFLLSQLHQLGN